MANEQLQNSLIAIARIMDENQEPVYLSLDLSKIRQFFYMELWGMILERGGRESHLFYLITDNYFSKLHPTYEEKNIRKWSESNLIAFETHQAIVTFFDCWLQQMDVLFEVAYADIVSVIRNQNNK